LAKSIIYAVRGLGFVVATQRNMRVHLVAAVLAVMLGWVLSISRIEWIVLALAISLVLVAEGLNTAVEIAVDLATRKIRLRAMLSKDIAAGGVLMAAINSLVVGYLLFFDRLVTLVMKWTYLSGH
jgi:diacylglycerol kinase (ATP)